MDEVLSLYYYAIENTCDLPDLVDALALVKKKPIKQAVQEVENVKTLTRTAQREVDSGFASIFEMATVLLWGALETANRDFIALWLAKYSQARETEAIGKIKLRFIDFTLLSPEQLYQSVVEQLERETAAPLKKGVGRFESLLPAVSISIPVSAEIRQSLLELSEVRNTLVHKAGTVDRRVAQSCPWIQLNEKETLRVTRTMYMKYNQSVRSYAASVLRAAHATASIWECEKGNGDPI